MLQVPVFRIISPKVVHQTIDSETIIIDFDSGAYFSTEGAGALIWGQVAANASVNDIVHALTERYAGECAEIEQSAAQFLNELQRESLIEPSDGTSLPPRAAPILPDANLTGRPPFEAPVLHKFTDMQDLLLLDPIHEMDDQGWPIRKDAVSG